MSEGFYAAPAARVAVYETGPGRAPAAPRLPPAFRPWLYFEPAHQALQAHGHPTLAFFLEDEAAGQTLAQLYVVPDGAGPGRARSPGQAPFGGVRLAPELPVAALHPLLSRAEAELRARGQHALEIGGYPFCYDPAGAATLAEALRQRGYGVRQAELNYYLDPARDFALHLHPAARRRLARLRRLGYVVEQEPPLLLPAAYEFIAACRRERGYTLSLSLPRLQALFAAFPGQYLLWSVRRPGGAWAALTVAIQAAPDVLYNFYPASPLSENPLSPSLLLHAGLHAHARAAGLRLLDLGTSTLPAGPPNVPLLRFKRRLGGVASLKLTWALDFG